MEVHSVSVLIYSKYLLSRCQKTKHKTHTQTQGPNGVTFIKIQSIKVTKQHFMALTCCDIHTVKCQPLYEQYSTHRISSNTSRSQIHAGVLAAWFK